MTDSKNKIEQSDFIVSIKRVECDNPKLKVTNLNKINAKKSQYKLFEDICEGCGDFLDEFAENGYCFNCLMNSCIPGNIKPQQ
jgi:hypothetical protein